MAQNQKSYGNEFKAQAVKLAQETMLSYIGQQHCRIIAFSRCLIVKCGVTPLKVVGVNILSNGSSGFFDVIVLCQIGFFILEATKPALNHDIVRPAAFSIHALADAIFFYKFHFNP